MQRSFFLLIIGLVLLFVTASDVSARDYYLDFPTLLQPRADELEWSAELSGMNEHLDLFNFRSRADACPDCSAAIVFGDSQGVKFLVNYGLSDSLALHGEYSHWSLENGFDKALINSGVLSLRKKLGSSLVAEAGVRGNRGSSLQVTEYNRLKILLNYLLHDNDFSFVDGASHFIVTQGGTTLYLDKAEDPVKITVAGMEDVTPYGRLLYGVTTSGRFHTTLFVEGGKSWISTDARVALHPDLAPLVELPQLRLTRTETFLQGGIDLLARGPWGTLCDLNWSYERLFRAADLDYVAYNQIMSGDLLLPVSAHAALRFGGSWYRRQFNGMLPFAYNRFTQTTFDHDYGTLRLGVVVSMP